MNEDRREDRRRNITVMVVVGVAMIVGIALRWDFIADEVAATWHNLFSPRTEQAAPRQ